MSATAAARLEPVAEELWTAEGPTLSFFGFPYPTRMAVARLSQGRLWVWSPVALDAALRREVEALGWRPRSLVIAHGRCAFDEGERVLRESLAWLRPGEAARAEV